MEFTPAAVSQYNRVQNEMEYGKNRISCRRKLANGRRYSLSQPVNASRGGTGESGYTCMLIKRTPLLLDFLDMRYVVE